MRCYLCGHKPRRHDDTELQHYAFDSLFMWAVSKFRSSPTRKPERSARHHRKAKFLRVSVPSWFVTGSVLKCVERSEGLSFHFFWNQRKCPQHVPQVGL